MIEHKIELLHQLLEKLKPQFSHIDQKTGVFESSLDQIEVMMENILQTDQAQYLYLLLNCTNDLIRALDVKSKEASLNAHKFQLFFDMLPDPIAITKTDDFYITEYNQAFRKIIGLENSNDHQKVMNTQLFEANSTSRHRIIESLNKEGQSLNIELTLNNFEGNRFTCLVSSRKVTYNQQSFVIHVIKDISYKKEYEQRILHLSYTDKLTQLHNRTKLDLLLNDAVLQAEKNNTNFFIAFIDIDFFKKINDTFGHSIGDLVLQEVSQILKNQLYGHGEVGRWGGEEFVAIIGNKDLIQVESFLNDLRLAIERAEIASSIRLTISIGFSKFEPQLDCLEATMNRADQALYLAKTRGRNQVCILPN